MPASNAESHDASCGIVYLAQAIKALAAGDKKAAVKLAEKAQEECEPHIYGYFWRDFEEEFGEAR